jgi:transglutaminase-like putative cysteine protease
MFYLHRSRLRDIMPDQSILGSSSMKVVRSVAFAAALIILSAATLIARERPDEFRTATPQELSMTAVDFAPGASAVILDWVQWRDDVDSRETEYVRIKILSEEGKKYGDVSIPYIPLIANLDKLEARTTKPDGTVVPFTGKTFEKLIVKTGGVRLISKTFSLPDVRPGSIIEYRYTLGMRTMMLYGKRFTVQRELPVVREKIWLRPYGSFYNFFGFRGLPPGKKPEMVDKDHYEMTLDNVPAFEEERYSPPEYEVKPIVNFYYMAEKVEVDEFWKKTGKELTSSIEDFISGDPTPIHNAAAEAVAGAATSEEKLRKLYAVTQKVRNLAYESDKTEAEERKLRDNKSAQDVLRNGYGYSGEITRLFVALARSAGFDAHSVRIGSRDDSFFSKKLPVSDQLDSEVALVSVDGKEMVFDPGTPNAPFGIVAWQKAYVPGMKLVKKQDAAWMQTPTPLAQEALVTRKAALHVDGEALKGKVTVTYKGQEALVRRLSNYTDDEAATKKALEDGIKTRFPEGAVVKLTKLTGMKTADPEVVAEYDIELPNAGSFAGSRALIPLSVFHATDKNPFAPATRRAAVYFHYPWVEEDEVTLDVPSGYAVETMPNPADLDANIIAYTTRYVNGTTSVQFKRHMMVNTLFVPKEEYEKLRTVYSRITSTDQEQVVLRKAPAKAEK